ncbi:hypothetical protein [Lacrimispora sphenoides]|uniref:hypothetical protein n=1 Tax=Lacrimispora sphenoides TaxID=29370 RepID=UPI001FA8CF96|nr:hypothetical protein [Lacrimispora sphenoides]
MDHIIPSNIGECHDDEVKQYLLELEKAGFIVDSIENYLPSCPACNIGKNNRVYTAANLRFFHEKARVHVDEILRRIDALKAETKEFFYEPVDTELWEELDFSYQRNISHAIMGYRLTPADVEACPKFPQVERIEKQLTIVDHVVVQGETGCGKSISVYQAAYDFYQKSWKVYRYKAIENLNVPMIQHNTEPSLYIIDDAQRLSEKAIEVITEQARPNTKILFAKTISSAIQHDTILLTNKDAVRILRDNFLSRKKEITSIVHQCDNQIGINFMDSPIERRLEGAEKAATPWQFNYILRGGWQTMKEQYQTICSHHDCGLLAASIAVFQIMKLDNGVNYRWLCNCLRRVDSSLVWDDSDLQYLVSQKIVLSVDDVRIVHMESAKVIIAQFLQDTSTEKKKMLYAAIETSFVDKEIMPLGLVWLCNGLLGYTFAHRYDEAFINEKMISSALECLKDVQTSHERAGITFFMEKVFAVGYEKNGQWYLDKHETLLLDWIAHADSKTAYSYSCLINTIFNTDKKRYRQFTQKVDWAQTIQSMRQERRPNLYVWGQLLNRLTFALPKQGDACIQEILCPVLVDMRSKTAISNIADLSGFLCAIAHLAPACVHDTVRKLLPVYREYFKKDMISAIYLFDFDFFLYICGMSLLGGHRATKEERRTAAALVEVLPVAEFAAAISNSIPRDWKSIHDIMCLVGQYDRQKAKKIVATVDIVKLSDMAKDSWCQYYEITDICIGLHIGDRKIAHRFIEYNQDRIQVVYSPLAMIAPQSTISVFEDGVPVELLTGHWWKISFCALRELIKTDEAVAKEILSSNASAIIKQLNASSAIDFDDDGCLVFLQLTRECDKDIFENIISVLDPLAISDRWDKSYINPRHKKQAQERYHRFLDLIKQ